MQTVALVIIGYLLGSIPFGYLVSRLRGVDIRKAGSGNIGGANVSRVLGIRWGLLSGFLDVLKAFFPAFVAVRILSDPWQQALVFISPVIGHIFSVWLGFKGGKGVACLFGVLWVLLSWPQMFLITVIWAVAIKAVKITSLVNLIMVLLLPLVLLHVYSHVAYTMFGLASAVLIWYAHRSNISRLLKGTELKLPI